MCVPKYNVLTGVFAELNKQCSDTKHLANCT